MDLSLSFLKYRKFLFWIKYLTVELLKISFSRKVSYENIIIINYNSKNSNTISIFIARTQILPQNLKSLTSLNSHKTQIDNMICFSEIFLQHFSTYFCIFFYFSLEK